MANINSVVNDINRDAYKGLFTELYGENPQEYARQKQRYLDAVAKYEAAFGRDEISIFSTPGRTEVGGNHTDHNAGRVLAAAVNLDAVAVAAKNSANKVLVQSEGYDLVEISLNALDAVETEKGTSASLVRGICSRVKQLGYVVGGFNAYITSEVLKGSGLSSSAAYEVLITTILNCFFNNGAIDDITNAIISQYAENAFFGKPCGLMDQTTCAVGGFVTIDFRNFAEPAVEKVDFDFSKSGYTMVIVDTGGNHADLNDDYADLEHEMKMVARALGGEVLRDCSLAALMENVASLRTKVHDRAILRAFHFYYDDARVVDQVKALRAGEFSDFLKMIIASGEDSWMLCQNCYSSKNVREQGISIALAVSAELLAGEGAWRVHGGGFAGTVQAFVPNAMAERYIKKMENIFGAASCYQLIVRPHGTIQIC